jgi:DNA-directed RNA polymerase specialized sigma24 family protein
MRGLQCPPIRSPNLLTGTNGMDDTHPRGLTQEEFDIFLSKLHPDRESAGEEYILLWQKLFIFFQSRSCLSADELVDETINRVAKKIAGGEEPRNISAYCHGFAKNVWLEYLKNPGTNRGPLEEIPPTPSIGIDEIHRKERQKRFSECLKELPIDDARLLIEYWCHEDRPNRDFRKEMAERLKISPTALRIRIYRIKSKVDECVKKRLGEKTKKAK